MTLLIRSATAADIPALMALMTSFYAEADFPLPAAPATRAFETLVADPRLGGVLLATEGGEAVGHAVLTLSFSMEYGGLRAFVDDLYVSPAARARGVGYALLCAVRSECAARGVRALHVEVGPENGQARRLYARAGYVDSGHLLLSLPLASPVHAT
jgi:ribosomal protein S18 acetylase RimI-like enzyme